MNLITRETMIVGSVCLAAGAVGGYFVAAKRVEKKYELLAEQEIEKAREAYRLRAKEGHLSDPTTAFPQRRAEEFVKRRVEYQEYKDTVAVLGYDSEAVEAREREAIRQANIDAGDIPEDEQEETPEEESTEEPKPTTGAVTVVEAILEGATTMNVFDRTPPTPEETGEPLDKDKPYVITIDEYMTDEPEYEKITITYYDGDDILADDKQEIIPDIDLVIGSESLKAFNGQTVIYVRNDKVEADFEVVLDPNSYAEVVYGISPDDGSAR